MPRENSRLSPPCRAVVVAIRSSLARFRCRANILGCCLLSLSLSLACLLGPVKAATVAVDDLGTLGYSIYGEGTLGWQFQTNAALTVTSLGFFDYGDDGLNVSHDVGIWDSDQNLIGSATVPAGSTASLFHGFRYVSVTPINLAANATYVIAATQPSPSNNEVWITTAQSYSVNPNLSWEARAFIQGAGTGASLTYPTTISAPTDGVIRIFGPNFQFNVVPEPASVSLLGLGMLLVGWRRKRIKHTNGLPAVSPARFTSTYNSLTR